MNDEFNSTVAPTSDAHELHDPNRTPSPESLPADAMTTPGVIRVIKRGGAVVPFEREKIRLAVNKAYLATADNPVAVVSASIREKSELIVDQIEAIFARRMPSGGAIHIEEIQDQVELALMRTEEHKVARTYVLYREKRANARKAEQAAAIAKGDIDAPAAPTFKVHLTEGGETVLDQARLRRLLDQACGDLPRTDPGYLLERVADTIYDGISESDLLTALIMEVRARIETEPQYTYVAARLLLSQLHREALGYLQIQQDSDFYYSRAQIEAIYPAALTAFIRRGIALERLDPRLADTFDLDRLGTHLVASRDDKLTYLSAQTLYDRYFISQEGIRYELPQVFFMRIAMGLSLKESDPNARAIEFYDLLSTFHYLASTPTLFNAGTVKPQLSSCYLSTVPDSLAGIFGAIHDNAMLSKWAGGLGNDWTPVRSLGSYIQGTGGKSQGIVPFLKVANDTALAVNQGGKRKGALCSYLETWHLDIEEFLELRKNTGDDRRRTHDTNTANWIPDLFMKRLFNNAHWTLFSPADVGDLHDLIGRDFEARYEAYEAMTETGEIKLFKRLEASTLWRKMLTMLFETGHPWITFKDACNLRSPQQHVGRVHSSNLCTEITLNTAEDEIAVCNLGSINLLAHLTEANALDTTRLRRTVRTAVRMLDNVIDINLYPVPQAETANMRHRAIGLGIMGFQDVLHKKCIPYASDKAVDFADQSMEIISYYAIEASADLAADRGAYQSFAGSLWNRGILPIDSLDLLQAERGSEYMDVDRTMRLDWAALRARVREGMRNSNVLAIAPTATIANIAGVSPCVEPTFQNLYVKSNLSGEFTVVNPNLVEDLCRLNLWDDVMINDIKYFDGSIKEIDRIPDHLKELYATAFEIDPQWILKAASRRQKWIDQAQSLNIYINGTSGNKLDETYRTAWLYGLKTTYYLRTLAATGTEKSTLERHNMNAVAVSPSEVTESAACALDDSDCEACQ